MNINNPLISVIIPAFNAEKYLKEALESVIKQNYHPLEIILIDDGSTDNTAKIAKSFQNIKYIYQENSGHAIARNNGIKIAKGEFIAFLDADDLWTPNKLSLQINYLNEHPDINYVLGQQKIFLESGIKKPKWLKDEYLDNAIPAYLLSALLTRKSIFNQIGYFDSSYKHGNDSDWLLKTIDARLSMYIIPEIVLLKRIHDANQSHNIEEMKSDVLSFLRASIKRKNKQNNL
ncbi:glycosyltransferase family A protein [Geminocystis sp. GBBB08]|uniref:glycosyltransferase family 2 protein n=1 Tax=Geminocystis sp. GBBB08 TaxID=2604140 RepID=UPI0027E39CDA|nr:glycosyltransferase family A protein [Geminocystis sp. GBBB08]MBL1211027.1 glycosyltransferase family 2 protein [Geminocystis sp. GBBB08]